MLGEPARGKLDRPLPVRLIHEEHLWRRLRRSVERALDAEGPAAEDVGVDHGRADVFVTEQLLDGADVGPGFQQVGREGVAQGVGADGLWDAGGEGGAAPSLPT